jgi:cysteinyl-tRNA synthetase
MSTKYLGKTFDIHGGGNDLKFPHHENEVAQNYGSCGCTPAKTWMHGNMLLLNGKKMAKSDGNSIMPDELFTGNSPHISKGYSPMAVRFFMLQTHYRSTLDLTDEALQAAEKGYRRLMEAFATLQALPFNGGTAGAQDAEVKEWIASVFDEMNDDFNTPKALARLFEVVSRVNSWKGGQISMEGVSETTFQELKNTFQTVIFDIFGLQDEAAAAGDDGFKTLDGLMRLIIDMRADVRARKDWPTADKIRDTLKEVGIVLKDGKEGTEWSKE